MNNSILAALFMIFLSGCERPIQHVKCYNNTGKVIYEGVAYRQGIIGTAEEIKWHHVSRDISHFIDAETDEKLIIHGDCFFERKNERIIK